MRRTMIAAVFSVTAVSAAMTLPVCAQETPARPWMNDALSPTVRAKLLLSQMTTDEKLTLMMGYFGTAFPYRDYQPPKDARPGSAGYVPGIARLGIPAQWQTDAGIGVATQGAAKEKRGRTALPSNLAIAATWNPETGFRGGAMIGAEARASGFNVMLAGGVNLVREPRNGRNFEYGGEDPLLAGTMVGSQIAGVQSNHIISTVKHFAMNDQETDRNAGNFIIDHGAARESDLLAFKIAIEKGNPGSVMCAYNKVDGDFACQSPWLLHSVLREDWKWPGYVMSDWGATHSTIPALKAGLDQESGYPFDKEPYFGANLKAAVADGSVSVAQIDQAVSRILFAMFRHGLFDHPVTDAPMTLPAEMLKRDAAVSRAASDASIVLMKNENGILPLVGNAKKIVVIGGHADKGVVAGGGSSLVYPVGGNAVPGLAPEQWPGPVMYYPSAPLDALRKQMPGADISFVDGSDPAAAAEAAGKADVAIVFATQWTGESFDVPLTLPNQQDALIDAVADANNQTVVVLETGGAVLTPWKDKVSGIVEAWFPGSAGGEAIADVLTGRVNPSGHLPISFPASLEQLPHPGEPVKGETTYSEGAAVGYKWYDAHKLRPAFAFGHGLSYTSFSLTGLSARVQRQSITVSFDIANTGTLRGSEVAQIYVAGKGFEAPRRLGGFEKVMLAPGQRKSVTVPIDPRMFATFDSATDQWKIAGGVYRISLGSSSADIAGSIAVDVPAMTVPVNRFD